MNLPLPAAPHGPPPRIPPLRVSTLLKLSPSGQRLPAAVRAALSTGIPVATGWAAGDLPAGLMASIGAFTSLYASDRPYLNRALVLAGVALSLALAVSLGVWAQQVPQMVVPVVVAIAMVATFICNSLSIGPPGAYMFALACAAGTAMPASHLAVWQVGLLVLSGGAISWIVHMAAALIWPRGPEKTAIAAAADAVAHFAEAAGTAASEGAQHTAALALHNAWATLLTRQPARPAPNGCLTRLRALNRELHLLFVACVNAANQSGTDLTALAEQARHIGAAATSGNERVERTNQTQVPVGPHGIRESFFENLRPGSPALIAAGRVGVAVAAAGVIGAAIGLERAYWAMAAAVLVLHQGWGWTQTLQRGVDRMIGTLAGLFLAALILTVHPAGLWFVATLISLQFLIEMVVTRNYALAVVFITAMALTISTGGLQVPDPERLLWMRGSATVIGCLTGLLVYVVTASRSPAISVRQEIARTLTRIKEALEYVASGEVTTNAAKRARRDLQHSIFVLVRAYEIQAAGMPRHRAAAEQMWPAVAATQRLGYKVLAMCWSLEEGRDDRATGMAGTPFTRTAFVDVEQALTNITAAVLAGIRPGTLSPLPDALQLEIRNLSDSLVSERDYKRANPR